MSNPNINAVLKMTKDYLDGKIGRIDYELDFPYEVEKDTKRCAVKIRSMRICCTTT